MEGHGTLERTPARASEPLLLYARRSSPLANSLGISALCIAPIALLMPFARFMGIGLLRGVVYTAQPPIIRIDAWMLELPAFISLCLAVLGTFLGMAALALRCAHPLRVLIAATISAACAVAEITVVMLASSTAYPG
jgi:hypothetical protein